MAILISINICIQLSQVTTKPNQVEISLSQISNDLSKLCNFLDMHYLLVIYNGPDDVNKGLSPQKWHSCNERIVTVITGDNGRSEKPKLHNKGSDGKKNISHQRSLHIKTFLGIINLKNGGLWVSNAEIQLRLS
ncbi:MAG: hypothetical protein QM786_01020 [Breznakibacter sp.]